jgi:hypothetical protein
MNNRKFSAFALIAMAWLGTGLWAIPVNAEETTVAKPARVASTIIKRAAIVEAVDREKRELKLIDAEGNRFTLALNEAVRNFDQIEPRDRIIAEYVESVAVVVAPSGSKPLLDVEDGEYIAVAPAGDKPAVTEVETEMITATVEAINATDRLVTLQTEDGELRTIKVSDDAPLDQVEVGDQLRLRVTVAVAISIVEPDDA